MEIIIYLLFFISGVYAIVGNLVVYNLIVKRGVTVKRFFAGYPGYLYSICVKSDVVSNRVTRFALSTNYALFAMLFFATIMLLIMMAEKV